MAVSAKFRRLITITVLSAFLLACLVTVLRNSPFMHNKPKEIHTMKMYRTKEPLMILGDGDGDYILPVGAVLYYDHGFDEGHSLYWTPVYHQGKLECEEVLLEPKHQGRLVAPLWLENINAEELKFLFKRFPLSRSDVEAVIKANEITKDDLIDIIRSMPD